jgi:hypothetical protein
LEAVSIIKKTSVFKFSFVDPGNGIHEKKPEKVYETKRNLLLTKQNDISLIFLFRKTSEISLSLCLVFRETKKIEMQTLVRALHESLQG